jgi:hypothetical protein
VVVAGNPRGLVGLSGGKGLPGAVIGRVGVSSAVSRWLGESVDLSMAIDGLLGGFSWKG